MKAHLAKLSLALLSTVFLFGCQDMGSDPLGPEGLGIQAAKVKECPGHPSCKEPPPLGTTFDVTIVSSQISSPDAQATTALDLFFENFQLNLAFFNQFTGCNSLGIEDGTFIMTRGDADGPHVHVNFGFKHSESGVESKHNLSIEGVPDDVTVVWSDPNAVRVSVLTPCLELHVTINLNKEPCTTPVSSQPPPSAPRPSRSP